MATATKINWNPAGATGGELIGYHNCAASLKIAVRPWTRERHAAMLALIHFRQLSREGKTLFDKALLAGMKRSGEGCMQYGFGGCPPILGASPYGLTESESRALYDLRNRAYGFGLDQSPENLPAAIVRLPWALTDKEFVFCYRVIKYGGKVPEFSDANDRLDGVAQKMADMAWDRVKEEIVRWLVVGTIAVFKTATKGMRGSLPGILIGAVVDLAKDELIDRLKEADMQNVKAAYEIDRVRRGVTYVS